MHSLLTWSEYLYLPNIYKYNTTDIYFLGNICNQIDWHPSYQ